MRARESNAECTPMVSFVCDCNTSLLDRQAGFVRCPDCSAVYRVVLGIERTESVPREEGKQP